MFTSCIFECFVLNLDLNGKADNTEQQADILYLAQEKYFTLICIKAPLQLVLKNILLPELFFQYDFKQKVRLSFFFIYPRLTSWFRLFDDVTACLGCEYRFG